MALNYDLVALDVDGTLLTDEHVLTDAVREAVREAAAKGAQIVLCSGRGPGGVLPVMKELELAGTLISHNGAATVSSYDHAVVHQYEMTPEYLAPYIAYCKENGVHFDLNTAFEMMVERMTPEAEVMYARFHAKPAEYDFTKGLPAGLLKFTVFGSKEQMDIVQADWEQWPARLQSIRSGDFFIDVQHADANKGKALRQLALSLGIDRNRILAIGNYYNDISMLEFAGLGIAMDNSPELVKQSADAVTLSNHEDGVAAALRKYV
ncbi:Cof-type HAD-IIB family hydrolase [Paenibacillus harenae]|uniref:Cof-type HAD-IIB family hydrolase n=1 Tax=Paenibacillus harenae TaxID=306543 RepID=UPI0027919AC4|nr:Cof-type HAD-IIB family hydrolase [Paenibacillus harenae]MDQ0058417.1 Cof subfamily protein (haloacid dehalogenase superfamily) [Paenibacillus harenae]